MTGTLRRAGVLRERNFRRFYAGYATSLLGTSMSTVATAWAVLASGGGASGLGYVMTASVVPQVLFMAGGGVIADRFGRRRVMLAADVLRFAAQASLALALFAGRPPLWLFILLSGARGLGEAVFGPALGALTAEIAPRDQLGNANALYGLATSASRIAGPALGGLLVALAGPPTVIALDAGSYGASVLALSLLRFPAAPAVTAAPVTRPTLRRDLAEGWAEFTSRTWLWVTTLQFALFNLITWAPWMLLGPVLGREYLGGAAVWGAIMAVQGAGAIAASLLSLGRRPRRPLVVATIGTFCYAIPDIPMALHASAPWVAGGAFVCGAGGALFGIYWDTAFQQQVPPAVLARVSAFTVFPAYGIGVVGYVVDGPLASALGPAAVFAAGAAYGLASSAAVLAVPAIRAIRWAGADGGVSACPPRRAGSRTRPGGRRPWRSPRPGAPGAVRRRGLRRPR
jgi:MFS family permease